ncbi:uncharacterized protein LOC142091073 isoform X2 [Calonectris borealis]|uniref:uncharacterized protein LOC142091073 isoform X2 n=1 Tax=Calonectris borealis TaxID=1323832 RepID=UPI003F4B66CD
MLALLQHLRSTRRRGGHLPEDVIAALQGAEERTLPSGCWYRVGAVGVLELDLYIREGSGSRLEGDVWRLPLLPRPAGCRLLLGDAVSCYGHMHMTAKRVPSPSRRLSRGLAVNTVQWLTSLVALEAPLWKVPQPVPAQGCDAIAVREAQPWHSSIHGESLGFSTHLDVKLLLGEVKLQVQKKQPVPSPLCLQTPVITGSATQSSATLQRGLRRFGLIKSV